MKITIADANDNIIEQRDANVDDVFDNIVDTYDYELVRTSWRENKNGRSTFMNKETTLILDYQEGSSAHVCETCLFLINGVIDEERMDGYDMETAVRNVSRYLIEVSDRDDECFSTVECVACETSVPGTRWHAKYYA